MKRFGNIFLPTLCILLCLTIFTSCQTTNKQNDTEEKSDTIPKTPPPPEWVDTSKTLKEKTLIDYLTSKSTYGEATAACFQPHFALVFYKDNKIINQINVCLDCNYLISDIAIPAETHKKVNAGTKEEYAITGFTDKGKKAIIDLCKELIFTYRQEEKKSK